MHSSCAGVVPCCNELLRILLHVRLPVVLLSEGASEGHVAILNVKATRETHIPIIVPFVHIRKVRFAHLLLLNRRGNTAPIRDNMARHCWHGSRDPHVVRKWSTNSCAPSLSMVMAATTLPTSRVKTTRRKCLLQGDGHLLHGQHLEHITCHKPEHLLRLQCQH